jgi:hypothetical protein
MALFILAGVKKALRWFKSGRFRGTADVWGAAAMAWSSGRVIGRAMRRADWDQAADAAILSLIS